MAEPIKGANIAHGRHDVDGVVYRCVNVFLLATELGADEDATGDHGDDAEELLVDVDLDPVIADRKLATKGLLHLLGDGRVETGWPDISVRAVIT